MRNLIFLFALSGIILTSCSRDNPPKKAFEAYPIPEAPDYSQETAWSCLPDKKDYADSIPKTLTSRQDDQPKVDVFYIYPTIFNKGVAWNASIFDEELNGVIDEYAIKNQATAFNESGQLFIPRYRQMNFGGFFTEDTVSKRKALELAYSDVLAAFDYFIQNLNQGRPFVIAGHSQGSLLGLWLLRDKIDGTELQKRMVAAYVPGWPFQESAFSSIPVGERPEQTGCVLGWCSWREGSEPKSLETFYKNAVVVNPVTWRRDGEANAADEHLGFVGKNFSVVDKHLVVKAHQGILWVSRPIPIVPTKNYHFADINLFWLNIRQNLAQRTAQYFAEHPEAR
ncbi:MAG: DUF3089 domain-containing protein [Bacteroidota bacterium]